MKGLFSLVPVARSREVDLAPRGPPCLLPRSAPGQLPVSGATFQAGKRVGLRGKASATPGPALGRGGACLETSGGWEKRGDPSATCLSGILASQDPRVGC